METTHSNEILWKVSDFARNLKYLFSLINSLIIYNRLFILNNGQLIFPISYQGWMNLLFQHFCCKEQWPESVSGWAWIAAILFLTP